MDWPLTVTNRPLAAPSAADHAWLAGLVDAGQRYGQIRRGLDAALAAGQVDEATYAGRLGALVEWVVALALLDDEDEITIEVTWEVTDEEV